MEEKDKDKKTQRILDSMNAPKEIDPSVKIRIPRAKEQFDPEKHNFKCLCCGAGFVGTQKLNFQKTDSPLFQSNNGFLPFCKDCTEKYFEILKAFYCNNEEHAFEHFCQQVDWVYDIEPLKCVQGHSFNKSKVGTYGAKKNLNTGGRKSYFDTLRYNFENNTDVIIESLDDIEKTSPEYKITSKMMKFWGFGYDQKTYSTLQGYYDELLKLCSEKPDVRKQKLMKNLCLLEYQMQINIQTGKDIGTLSNSYNTMFKAAELKTDSDTSEDTFGKWIMEIEKYSPAEYYEDKKKYHDFFGIKEYIERFMFRPLKNLIMGTKEKEKEYWIDDDGDQ